MILKVSDAIVLSVAVRGKKKIDLLNIHQVSNSSVDYSRDRGSNGAAR